MKKNFILFLLLQFGICIVFAQPGSLNIEALEKNVQQAVRKSYGACVSIMVFDSATKKPLGICSGVVIDSEGHILSAAHAITPGKLYEVRFPDGHTYKANRLGRIESNDAAMLKISEKGTWPYAEMGWSSSLAKDMPCISMAYPGSLRGEKPTVRFGYIEEVQSTGKKEGYIRNTCLMEPGDSGGPLFDLKGRIIGLRSKVELSLNDNLDIPINIYRQYSTALRIPAMDYKELPASEKIPPDLQAADLKSIPGIRNIGTMLKKVEKTLSINSITIQSKLDGVDTTILGTLVSLEDILPKKELMENSFLVSKSSMVGNDPAIVIKGGKRIEAKILNRDKNNDLVLLQIPNVIKGGLKISSISQDSLSFKNVGGFLISPQPFPAGIISVLGNTQFAISKNPAIPGYAVQDRNGKIRISFIFGQAPAGRAGLKIGDNIISVNGKTFQKSEDLAKEEFKYKRDDTLNIKLERDGVSYTKQVILDGKGTNLSLKTHVASEFTDKASGRSDGFDHILVHDGRLKPAECGGPLYDIRGHFYGINIARISRTSSLAIPAAVLSEFVKKALVKVK